MEGGGDAAPGRRKGGMTLRSAAAGRTSTLPSVSHTQFPVSWASSVGVFSGFSRRFGDCSTGVWCLLATSVQGATRLIAVTGPTCCTGKRHTDNGSSGTDRGSDSSYLTCT